MKKIVPQLDNLEAFITEARASANVQKDIRLIQQTYNLTEKELAAQFGVTQQTISGWLRGKFQPKCKNLIHYTAEKIRSPSQK
jgi:DNA-binding transcriptional regulator YiaG